ncbi:MAG: helix-turn-helix domain-containing protein, partial [Thermoplasmatota archaeon]
MKTPGHEGYTVLKTYKQSDRKAYKSKRRQLLDQKPTFAQKKWAVKRYIKKEMKVESIAEFMGKSRATIYRWIKEVKDNGIEALKPKSKRP